MIIDHFKKTVKFKIVYHGPALAGKTTNVSQIAKLKGEDILSFNTKEERTLVFDMTKEERQVGDFKASFLIYTVPGQYIYSDIRKMVMRGVDGVVFVVDSSEERLKDNKEFIEVLEEDLKLYGKDLESTPVLIQYNKRDLPNALPIDVLQKELNPYNFPYVEAVALEGKGIRETLEGIVNLILENFGRMIK